MRRDAHKFRVLRQRVGARDPEVFHARRDHAKAAGEIDDVHQLPPRVCGNGFVGQPDPDPAGIGLGLSGAGIVHLRGQIGAGRHDVHRVGGREARPHARHVATDEAGSRNTVIPKRRRPKP